MINFLIWIVVGGIIGWVASLIMKRDASQGIFLNIIVGIVGAFLGGIVGGALGIGGGSINDGAFNAVSLGMALVGAVILLAIINLFTRMRYCTPRGRIGIEDKGTPGTQEQGLYPWFEVPGRAERDLKIVCGHWSALGLTITQGVHAIDTGAVWGGKLTALQLDTDELRLVQVPGRDVTPPA